MIHKVGLFLFLLAVVASASQVDRPRVARAEIEVRSQVAQNRFPQGIQFTLFVASDAEINDVRLRFRILPDGVAATVRPNCTTGAAVNCQATIGATQQNYMVPGASVRYTWEIMDANGARLDTPEETVVYEDDRFQWESITESGLTVHFYFGDEASQRNVMRVAQETIDRFSRLLNATIGFPIQIWVYRTAADMAPAVASRRGQGPNTSVQTLGEVAASDTALVSRDTDFLNIVRHELAHIVTGAATRGHLVDIPVWVNEGLSTYAQSEMLPSEAQALQIAVQRNRVLPITSLGASARGAADVVSLFYAQSGSIVRFMVERYGDEKFGQFVAELARETTDVALNKVYGFDQLGLENEWRKALNLPEVGSAPPPSGGGSNQPAPTATPAQSSQSQPNPTPARAPASANRGDDSGGGISLLMVAGGLGVVVVLLLAAAGGLYLKGRRPAA
jgi:hypothetical protein